MTSQSLVYGFVFDGQGGGNAITLDEVGNWHPEQGVLWLHFDYTAEQSRDWLRHQSGLEELVVDALLTEESRPRATKIGDALLIALRGVNLSPDSDPEDMVGIRIWSDGSRIISTRRRRMLSANDIVQQLQQGQGPRSASEFLAQLTYRLMARMEGTISDTEDQVSAIEETVLVTESYEMRGQIASLRRTLISLRRYLSPQREAMMQLQTLNVTWLEQDQRQVLREVTDHLIRYIEDIDSVRDRAAVAQEELSNRLAEQMNNRMYVLAIVAAIFLPLGFLTGLLGINVGGIPGTESPIAFWTVCFLLTLVVSIQIWVFKRRRWF